MDSQTITAYAGLIAATVGLLTAIGAGVSFLIRRADRRRESGDTELVAHLRKELRKLKRELDMKEADATSWRDQLLENGIKPNPAHWTPIPEDYE